MSQDKSREAFEAWCFGRFEIERQVTPSGWINYVSETTEGAWQGWQASRAQALEEAAAMLDSMQQDAAGEAENEWAFGHCAEAIRTLAVKTKGE